MAATTGVTISTCVRLVTYLKEIKIWTAAVQSHLVGDLRLYNVCQLWFAMKFPASLPLNTYTPLSIIYSEI